MSDYQTGFNIGEIADVAKKEKVIAVRGFGLWQIRGVADEDEGVVFERALIVPSACAHRA